MPIAEAVAGSATASARLRRSISSVDAGRLQHQSCGGRRCLAGSLARVLGIAGCAGGRGDIEPGRAVGPERLRSLSFTTLSIGCPTSRHSRSCQGERGQAIPGEFRTSGRADTVSRSPRSCACPYRRGVGHRRYGPCPYTRPAPELGQLRGCLSQRAGPAAQGIDHRSASLVSAAPRHAAAFNRCTGL